MSAEEEIVDDVGNVIADQVVERLTELSGTVNSALNGVSDAMGLTEKVEQSPYGMVAAALGVGYVLGGGLFTPTTARLINLAMKAASVPLVRDQLLDFAEAAVDGMLAPEEEIPPEPKPRSTKPKAAPKSNTASTPAEPKEKKA